MPHGPATDSRRHYVYVDNICALADSSAWVKLAQASLINGYADHKLEIHGHEILDDTGEFLGTTMCARLFERMPQPERMNNLRLAILAVLRRGRISGWVFEVIVGHATFVGLSKLGVLIVFPRCLQIYRP